LVRVATALYFSRDSDAATRRFFDEALLCSVIVKTVANTPCVYHQKVWVAVIKAKLSGAAARFESLRAG
jgi:hypothetical protein